MGDKGVLSDLFLFKQVDDAVKREAREDDRQVQSPGDGKRKKIVVIKRASPSPEFTSPQFPDILKILYNYHHINYFTITQ